MSAAQFVGTWKLVSQTALREDGSAAYPRGDNPQGVIMYDAAGNMSVQLMRTGHSGDLGEYRTAMEQFLAYYGTYRVDEAAGTVTHVLEGCSFPDWIGTQQVRHYKFEGDHLQLTAAGVNADGRPETRVILWQRVS
jgi:hypothetical protein